MPRSSYLPLVALALLPCAIASSGDRAQVFQVCLKFCATNYCSHSPRLDLPLRLAWWTYLDDCKYRCMHEITNATEQKRQRGDQRAHVEQYYGKWPFWRLLGMQEPASVLFSLLNLCAHVKGGRYQQKKLSAGHPMRAYYRAWTLLGINSWICSALFHTRDTPLTEKLDYFSAAASIMFALYGAGVRLFHAYDFPTRWQLWTATCLTAYITHVTYMAIAPRFDYTWNIIFNVALGTLHNLFWLAFSVKYIHFRWLLERPTTFLLNYYWKPGALAIFTTFATCFELFDFPPWRRIIDAHSLWHLVTAPITILWYRFLTEDGLDAGWKRREE
ncbi:hypothetical protein FRB93_001664 [Tulasnella sp. JGI-2019a]|nr:hypothetical protein FRB93_001664 [Tulasnella sp. JGI-2019a]